MCDAGLELKTGLANCVCARLDLASYTLRVIMQRRSLECHKPLLL